MVLNDVDALKKADVGLAVVSLDGLSTKERSQNRRTSTIASSTSGYVWRYAIIQARR